MKKNASDKQGITGLIQNSLCKDCVFWYQCRQGKVDCHLNSAHSAGKAVGA